MNLPEFVYTVLLKPKPLRLSINWLLKKLIPSSIKTLGAIIHLNPNDPVVSGAIALNVFEKDEIFIFKKLFEADMTFLDVGANVGLYSALALSAEDFSGKVICLEPHEESLKYLRKTLSSNQGNTSDSNIIISTKAASDFHGEALLYTNPNNKGDNRLYSDELLSGSQPISVTTIDNICQLNNVKTIHFIKIDVQGAEGLAIAGASSILENSKDCIILSELWPYGLSKYSSGLRSYIEALEKFGFKLFCLAKRGELSSFLVEDIEKNYTGRKYTNIVGIKGKYLSQY